MYTLPHCIGALEKRHGYVAVLYLLFWLVLVAAKPLPVNHDASQRSGTSGFRVLQASSTTIVPLPSYILGGAGLEEAETIIVALGPLWGRLCFYSSSSPCLESASSFTREDIMYGNVFYEATGDNFTIDAFLLSPSEFSGSGQHNGSWYVVRGPDELTGSSFAVLAGVKRGGKTTIDADWIDSIQDTSASSSIQVIEDPKLGRMSLGDRFMVRDLVEGKLAYYQDSNDAGCSDEVVMAIIEGNRYRLLVLQLAIYSGGNSGNVISLAVRNVTANSSSFVLTKAEVDVPNAPYCDSLVRLRITRAPSEGLLLIIGTPLLLGDSFTLEDLRNGLVWYNSPSSQTDLVDHIGLTLQLPAANNVAYNASEAHLGIRVVTCWQCNQRYTFNVSSHTVQLSRINMEGTFGTQLDGVINVDIQPKVPLQMVFLLFSIDRHSPLSLGRNGIPISERVISLFDLQSTQLILSDSTGDNQYDETVRYRIAVLTSAGDVVYSRGVYSLQVQWAKLCMELDYHTVSPGNSVKASIKVEGFVVEDVDVIVSTWKHLPSDALCWGIRLPGNVCMTQSSVVISSVTKQSSYIITADEQDLGKKIGVHLQTARNAVKCTNGSRLLVQVTEGSNIGLGPRYISTPSSPVCNKEVQVKETDGVLNVMLVRMNGLQERAGVICSTATVTGGATADEDFVSRPRNTSSVVYFDVACPIAYCPVRILHNRKWEPKERFIVTVSSAGGPSHIVSEASTLCVYITSDDVPSVSFQKGSLRVKEPRFARKTYQVPIYRHAPEGSLDYRTVVNFRVLQRQSDRATEDTDFQGQPNWNSLIFNPNEGIAYVNVEIFNDVEESEGDEGFHIEIQRSDNDYLINGSDSLAVVIEDARDVARYSVVKFLHNELVVSTRQNVVSIPLRRFGNLGQTSRIRCTLESGTAVAGVDFWKTRWPQRETFAIGSQELQCSVLLLPSPKKPGVHGRKSFTVRLEAEDNHTVISTGSMQVHINQPYSNVSSPAPPRYTAYFTQKVQTVLRSGQYGNVITVPVKTSSNFPSNAKMTCSVSPSAGISAMFTLQRGCVLRPTNFCNRCMLKVTLSTSDARIGISQQNTTTLYLFRTR